MTPLLWRRLRRCLCTQPWDSNITQTNSSFWSLHADLVTAARSGYRGCTQSAQTSGADASEMWRWSYRGCTQFLQKLGQRIYCNFQFLQKLGQRIYCNFQTSGRLTRRWHNFVVFCMQTRALPIFFRLCLFFCGFSRMAVVKTVEA